MLSIIEPDPKLIKKTCNHIVHEMLLHCVEINQRLNPYFKVDPSALNVLRRH